jgi:hypothetical protein
MTSAPDGASPWSGRSHAQLAELARELLLAGHLIDRSGMPHLIAQFGQEAMRDIAIDEWMAASPIYTKRMQRLLHFEGDTVETIFKGLQLDIGAPPEFMDFRYEIRDEHHGEFHLAHCGALMDVEPLGEDYVRAMCHDIEDPTFDATATATNPRARVRPIHRPPRIPADREPHCAWTVTIEPDREPLTTPPQTEELRSCHAAALPLPEPPRDLAADDGLADYSGAFDPDLVMDRFSSATLATILDETALQGQLLSRAYLMQVAQRVSGDETRALGIRQAAGIAGLTAKRLHAAMSASTGVEGLAAVLGVHPLLLPRAYCATRVERAPDGGGIRLGLGPCPALDERDGLTWASLLAEPASDAILDAIVVCVDPRASVQRIPSARGDVATWEITSDPDAPARSQPSEVTLTEFSTGAEFAFERRG